MADTSPGKVQALRAMFTQKDSPVMGLIPPNTKLGTRPWKHSLSSLTEDKPQLPSKDSVQTSLSVAATCAMLKTCQGTVVSKSGDVKTTNSDKSCDTPCKIPQKPNVGPKPLFVKQQCRTVSSPTFNLTPASVINKRYENNISQPRTKSENMEFRKNYDTIASFMFVDTPKSVSCENSNADIPKAILPKPKSLNDNCNSLPDTGVQTVNGDVKMDAKLNSRLSLINSDNYICKSSCSFIRNELTPKEKLGPPPPKPEKPPHMKLPERYCTKKAFSTDEERKRIPQKPARPSVTPPVLAQLVPQKPAYPCPPRPTTSPPVPPGNPRKLPTPQSPSNSSEVHSKSLLEEIEELYEDTLLQEMSHRPVSLIPEYSAEEEAGELYDDAIVVNHTSNYSDSPNHLKPKHPPPLPPTNYLDPIGNPLSEELYQDAIEASTDEFYEEMPVDNPHEDHYTNNRKEFEKMKREEEKRMKREIKEKEKKEKEFDKVKKKFGLTGEELPIDAGLVKSDSRGGKNDLQVKKGDVVYILRIEGNPPGKWLVKSKKGKYGYVELTNIEVDPDSVKSVMTIQRNSVISTSEELYSEAYSEEGIYEMTY